MTPDAKRQQRLIDDYVDGQLDPEGLRELADMLRSSEAMREQLARAAVVDRLLRASHSDGVSPGRMMKHLEEAGAIPVKPHPPARSRKRHPIPPTPAARGAIRAPATTGRDARDPAGGRRPLWVRALPGLCTVLVLGVGAGVWHQVHPRDTRRPPPPSEPRPARERPDLAGSGAGPIRPPVPPEQADPSAGSPPSPDTTAARVEEPSATAGAPPARVRLLPLALPPPPPGDALAPPAGDGSDEPGFVAPPPAWLVRAGRAPTPPRLTPDALPHARLPTLCVKMRRGHPREWGVTPDDVTTLLRVMGQRVGTHYGSEIRALDGRALDPVTTPILFFSGHYHFVLSDSERVALRGFMLGGGMVIFNAGLGSKPFYDSARRELRRILPECPLERLQADHPLYHSYYDMAPAAIGAGRQDRGETGKVPWLEGVTLACRTTAVISRWGLAAGWEGQEVGDGRSYPPEPARRLGINLLAYGAAGQAWTRGAAHLVTLDDSHSPPAGAIAVAQLIHGGEWQTRYAGLSMLLHSFNQRTEVPVKLKVRSMTVADADLFNMPLLYVTGHGSLPVTPTDVERLRQYLRNGGFLFAEACCGRDGFDRDFRGVMRRLFPASPLQPLPPDAAVFHVPNTIGLLGVTPALAAQRGAPRLAPRLEGITRDGHIVIIYSPYGLAGGWERAQAPYSHGYQAPDALKLGQNILMYAITE